MCVWYACLEKLVVVINVKFPLVGETVKLSLQAVCFHVGAMLLPQLQVYKYCSNDMTCAYNCLQLKSILSVYVCVCVCVCVSVCRKYVPLCEGVLPAQLAAQLSGRPARESISHRLAFGGHPYRQPCHDEEVGP